MKMLMGGRRLKKSLDYANKSGIPYVMIIGENELRNGRVKLKRMSDGSEVEIDLSEITECTRKLMSGAVPHAASPK